MLLLLDNTVLSNFALVGRIDLLTIAAESRIATTPQVIKEFSEGVTLGRLPRTGLDWLEIVSLEGEEVAHFQNLIGRVNAGEAACLAVAINRAGRILTDDRDARRLAAQFKVPVSGTLGVLLRLVENQNLTFTEANDLLGKMIAFGYRSPVKKLEDLA